MADSTLVGADRLAQLDLFDRLQLEPVLEIARRSRSLSDADRLRKYLGRFWLGLEGGAGGVSSARA